MLTVQDQRGRLISLNKFPSKIISVVPSQTELLFHLGLNDETIGITKFCVHPKEWFITKTRVGGVKTLNIELIRRLKPDIIFANKEENTEVQVKELQKEFPVYVSNIKNLDEAIQMIGDVGLITNKTAEAKAISKQIETNFGGLKPVNKLNTAYFIWQKPYMSIGGDTFINDMMKRCGFINVLANKTRYPETAIEELNALNCELILLASEPFPFKQKHINEIKAAGFNGKIMLVDGEMFSWYGSRLPEAAEYFQQLINKISTATDISF